MADHHTRHHPLGQDTLFTTPASLMLDVRLTPLERNGCPHGISLQRVGTNTNH